MGNVENYEHNHVLRDIITPAFGDNIGTFSANEIKSYTFSYQLNSDWVRSNCNIVAYVLNAIYPRNHTSRRNTLKRIDMKKIIILSTLLSTFSLSWAQITIVDDNDLQEGKQLIENYLSPLGQALGTV